MSDDASYTAFLDKANADPKAGQRQGQGTSTSESKSRFDPTIANSALPHSLKSLPDITYTSDTDSPFEPTVLNYAGTALPSAVEFAKCLSRQTNGSSVEVLSTQDFDPRGEYREVIQKVEQAGKGGVKVYRVEVGATRAEYYVLTLGEKSLVGVVTKAVES